MAYVVVGHFDEEVVRAHDDPPPYRAEPRARRVRDPLVRHRRSRRRLLRGRGSSCRRGRSGGVSARHGQPHHASRQVSSSRRGGGGWRRWRRTRRGRGRPRGSRGGCRGNGHRRYRTWRGGADGCCPHATAARGRALPAPERLLRVPAGASASAITAAVRLLVPCPAAATVGLLVPSRAAAADTANALAASPTRAAPSGTTARATRSHAEREGGFPSGVWRGSDERRTDEHTKRGRRGAFIAKVRGHATWAAAACVQGTGRAVVPTLAECGDSERVVPPVSEV
jgi:hypothetical protein